jgi:hypothetical protein
MFERIAHISKASVQDVVSNVFFNPYFCSKKAWHFCVNNPFPEILPEYTA